MSTIDLSRDLSSRPNRLVALGVERMSILVSWLVRYARIHSVLFRRRCCYGSCGRFLAAPAKFRTEIKGQSSRFGWDSPVSGTAGAANRPEIRHFQLILRRASLKERLDGG
jgi:hypothetical protein